MTYHTPDRRPIEERLANRTKPVRSPRECVEAALANLEMARNAASHRRSTKTDPADRQWHDGEVSAFIEAIALLRVECQSFLEEPNDTTTILGGVRHQ